MVSTTILHVLLFVESVVLFLTIRRLKHVGDRSLSEEPSWAPTHPPEEFKFYSSQQINFQSPNPIYPEPDVPVIYVVTPTYTRPTQLPDLTRLANTLRLVPRVHWLVAEDRNSTSSAVKDLLDQSTLSYTQLAASRPDHLIGKVIGRGVFNRRAAITWIRNHAHDDGIIYFADDDNSYDVRIFEELRKTRVVSVFPVGLILRFGVSSPIVKQGKVVGFFDAFQAGRKFAMDMAGFSVSVRHLRSKPDATFPARAAMLEEGFVQSLEVELQDLEPRAENCTRVWVWHTRTERATFSNISNIQGERRESLEETNLYQLHINLKQT